MTAATTAQRIYKTRNDLPEELRKKVIDLLNKSLATTLDLWTQIKYAHWNVKGHDFYQLHLLFDEIAGEVYEYIDLIAERVTALGGIAQGTVRMGAHNSTIEEYAVDAAEGKDHIVALADKLAKYGKLVRDGISKTDEWGDADTADLYTEISRNIDKRLWFLEAHIQH